MTTKRYTPEWKEEISATRRASGRGEINPLTVREMRPTARQIEWAAGFYEGEGSCGYWCSPTLKVAQRNKEPLEKLKKFFGGRLHEWTRAIQHDRPRNYKYWQWSINGARAVGFALTIYSLLSEKRKTQVREMLTRANGLKRRYRGYERSVGKVKGA